MPKINGDFPPCSLWLAFLAQNTENEVFFVEKYNKLLWFARRQAEARKFVKYVLFAKAEQKLEKIIENMPFEQQREHFGGQSRAFSWRKPMLLFFLHNRKPVFYVVFGGEKRPQSIFWCPKAHILRAFRIFPCLPRRIAESPIFYCEIMVFMDRKTGFSFFSPSKLD